MSRSDRTTISPGRFSDAPTPSTVESWLDALDGQEPARQSNHLTAILEKVRQSALPPEQRFKSIETCGRSVARLKRDLDRSLAALSLPLPANKEWMLRKCVETQRLLAECYKDVAIELVASDDSRLLDTTWVEQACYWGIVNLGEQLLFDYDRYLKVRRGIWLDIHSFYNIARAEGVQDIPVYDDDSERSQTVGHIYKRVLLLGLSDPFRHTSAALRSIYARLDEWAQLARLTTTLVEPGRCVFTIDPALDCPAMPALSRSSIRAEFDEKWLSTRELVDTLKRQHKATVKAVARRQEATGSVAESLDSIELLRRMIVNLGIHPIRNATRCLTGKNCDLVVGIKSVCVALNNFVPLPGRRTGPSTVLIGMIRDAFTELPSGSRGAVLATNQWEIADESMDGWRIVSGEQAAAENVSVGDLVALTTGPAAHWHLGRVRWAQTGRDNKRSLGIKKIVAPAKPVMIYRLGADQSRGHTRVPALLLSDESDNPQTLSLVCDKAIYSPTATYAVQTIKDKSEQILEATGIISSTRSFVWFKVRQPRAHTLQPKQAAVSTQ